MQGQPPSEERGSVSQTGAWGSGPGAQFPWERSQVCSSRRTSQPPSCGLSPAPGPPPLPPPAASTTSWGCPFVQCLPSPPECHLPRTSAGFGLALLWHRLRAQYLLSPGCWGALVQAVGIQEGTRQTGPCPQGLALTPRPVCQPPFGFAQKGKEWPERILPGPYIPSSTKSLS